MTSKMNFGNSHGPTSPSFIKEEPNDSPMMSRGGFGGFNEAYSMGAGNVMDFYNDNDNSRDSVNPADLTMGSMQVDQPFNRSQSNGFAHGLNYGMQVNDNDLLDTLGGPEKHDETMMMREPSMVSEYGIIDPSGQLQFGSAPDSRGHNSPLYHQPQAFSYGQHPSFRPAAFRGSFGQPETPSSMASPMMGASDDSAPNAGFEFININNGKKRPRGMELGSRKSPTARSPHTPRTPGIGGLTINTHEGSMPIRRHHQKSHSSTWDTNSPFGVESALSSPGIGPQQHDLLSPKYASVPTKVDNTIQSVQEQKRRRRRESHNMVERRRRDNINERIQELSHLVPQHRLEDEKIRKYLANNSALPTGISSSMSPPKPSMIGATRRPGSTVGTPLTGEEKDKGPNKGDILNGAVGWTRDLMWAHYKKLKQEEKIKEYIKSIGGTWPIEETEEEKRMASELIAAVEKNNPDNFKYTRAPGSGLQVPGFTNFKGEPLGEEGSATPDTSSSSPMPGLGGNSSASAPPLSRTGSNQQGWNNDGMIFKEEDEFNMDL